jgi:hypothetical protein
MLARRFRRPPADAKGLSGCGDGPPIASPVASAIGSSPAAAGRQVGGCFVLNSLRLPPQSKRLYDPDKNVITSVCPF